MPISCEHSSFHRSTLWKELGRHEGNIMGQSVHPAFTNINVINEPFVGAILISHYDIIPTCPDEKTFSKKQ